METIEEKTKALAIMYEPDYTIDDTMFETPFVVMKPRGIEGTGWWKDGRKVRDLFSAFKVGSNRSRACIRTGISIDQYKDFCYVHPHFFAFRDRVSEFGMMLAEEKVIEALKSGDISFLKFYLEKMFPQRFGRKDNLPPVGAVARLSAEAFLDGDGNMIVSKKTAEYLRNQNGDGENK